MRIVLFDLLSTGHHIKYASYLIQYLIEQEDEVKFITWSPNKYIDDRINNILSNDKFSINYLWKDCECSSGVSQEIKLSEYEKRVYWGLKYCYKIADEWKADIVHHLYLDRSEISVYLSLLLSTVNHRWRFFATLFSPYFIHSREEKVGFYKILYHKTNVFTLKTMLKKRRLNGLFVHTNNIKQTLIRYFKDQTLKDQIFVIPDPVEQIPNVEQRLARSYLNLPQNKTMLLFIGGVTWSKGIDILLESLALIKQKDWFLVIAGEPYQIKEEQIKEYKNTISDPNSLIPHLHFIPEDMIKYYFSAADIVILPYRKYHKGTSGILQLAASAGKPVIASDVGEIGQIVRENGLGILVESESPNSLADGIQYFLEKKENITKDTYYRAIQYAQNNDWRIMARKIREVYFLSKKKENG